MQELSLMDIDEVSGGIFYETIYGAMMNGVDDFLLGLNASAPNWGTALLLAIEEPW